MSNEAEANIAGSSQAAGGAPASVTGDSHSQVRVRRRTVFYLSGFDPQGPGRYHALYQTEAVKQAAVSGYRVEVGPRVRESPLVSRWSVQLDMPDGQRCDTRYLFMRWDDLVRAHWPRHRWALWRVTALTTCRLAGNGSLWRILQTSWPAFVALAMPGLSLLFQMALGMCGLILALVLWPQSAAGSGAAMLLTAAASWAAHHWIGRRTQTDWLMRSAHVILKQARGELPALESRLDQFASLLREELESADCPDEVLVVGHSSGAMLAISVVARALVQAPTLQTTSPLSLLTLGECVPVLSYQPQAHAFRDELRRLRLANGLHWLDVTAPPDGCCFALIDPTAACEAAGPSAGAASGAETGPKRISARFAHMFSPSTYPAIRRDKYRCHFQYLMASELPVDYDYFAITGGTQRLTSRFARTPSVTDFHQFQRFGSPHRAPKDRS